MESLSTSPANTILSIITLFQQCQLQQPTDYHGNEMEYDFIIVGGGSAGSVLANRLSENENWSILLIEAGGVPSVVTDIPAYYQLLQGTSEDWQFKSRKGAYCQGFNDGQCTYLQEKALGGGSNIDIMIAVEGNLNDYKHWFDFADWQWIKSKFRKVKEMMKPSVHESASILRNQIFQGAKSLGLSINAINDDDKKLGYQDAAQTMQRASKAYIAPIKNRTNLCIITKTQVTKIIIENSSLGKIKEPQATGVSLSSGKIINARKEVIISAGAINSPKLLMLSGIGPKEHLNEMNIKVEKDLPVGKNLQDHFMHIGLLVQLPDNYSDPIPNMTEAFQQYCTKREGFLGTIGIFNIVGWINTKDDSMFPDIQFLHTLLPKVTEKDHSVDFLTIRNFALKLFNFNPITAGSITDFNRKSNLFWPFPILLKPKSRGEVTLASDDPFTDPFIDLNLLKEDEDLETMLSSINFLKKLLATSAFDGARIAEIDIPNCRAYVFDTRDYWTCSLRNFCTSMFHPVGTCKMGVESDPTTVVSNKMKVHGIHKLRVVDASVMPEISSGNTNLPTLMIAETASDFIKEDY